MDELTIQLAKQQSGFLGFESVNSNNKGIFISYWQTKEDIDKWRKHATHLMAKSQAKKWYKRYLTQTCFVETSNEFYSEQ
jgi:heme-degrading monooxygenase HmoA